MALVAYMAAVGKPVWRETLVRLLWPEADPARGRKALRQTLWELNRTDLRLGLEVGPSTVGIKSQCLRVDLQQFQRKLMAAEAAKEGTSRSDLLWEALRFYRGRFLEGFALLDSQAFEDWRLYQEASWEGRAFHAFDQLTACLTGCGEYEAALEAVHLWLARDPFSESAQRRLMRLYAWSGRRVEAIRWYRVFESRLVKEIGVSPETRTRQLMLDLKEARIPSRPGPKSS